MFDVNKVRDDFAMFKNNPNMVYLDSAATSLTLDCVVDEMSDYYKKYRATVHRAQYKNGVIADNKYNKCRFNISKYLNVNENEIIFTRSTTSAMNLLAHNLISKLKKGDEILVSELEHHSTLLPFRELAIKKGINVKYINVSNNSITFKNVCDAITNNTKIVILHHVSNVIGDEIDVDLICNYLFDKNIISVIDGAQAITHLRLDVKKINCDFYVFSSHKVLGPTGIGVVYGKLKLLKEHVFEYGGDMAHQVTKEKLTTKDMPIGLEAGTPSIAEVIGLSKAFEYLNNLDFDAMNKYIEQLRKYMVDELLKIDGVNVYNKDVKSSIVTFNFLKDNSGHFIAPHDALSVFSYHDICIRGGHMCNMLTLEHLGVTSVLRASIYLYNTKEDIDKFIDVCKIIPSKWPDYMFL